MVRQNTVIDQMNLGCHVTSVGAVFARFSLCLQVHLETAPENLTSKGFDELKVSNALRYEVLTEILVSLGLSCELTHTPAPTPVHLLATSQVKINPSMLVVTPQRRLQ